MNKEHWKQKKRRHDRWIAKAKAANKVLDAPNRTDKDPAVLFSNPHQFPTCECQDDGERILFYQVEESKKAITYTFSVYSAYKKDPKSSLGIP